MAYSVSLVFFNATPMTALSGPQLSADLVTAINLDAADDGLGGIFAWNESSTATDDATNVFQPSSVSGPGRWIRISGQPASATFTTDVTFDQDLLLANTSTIKWGTDTTIARDSAGTLATSSIFASISNTNGAVYGYNTGAGPGVVGDSSGGTGYGVVAHADTTTPVKAALRLVPQDTAPSSPTEGDIYPNSGDHKLYFYNGTAWKEVAFV